MFESLNPVPTAERPDLLAVSTVAALEYGPEAKVFEIDPTVSNPNPPIACVASDTVGVRWVGGWREGRLDVC
ncbi:MAG: hypothetical protein FWF25_01565 [Propionibacteriaceae bacterium]|nr:hypothetical protein [Propionibacteriaceae bacterium]